MGTLNCVIEVSRHYSPGDFHCFSLCNRLKTVRGKSTLSFHRTTPTQADSLYDNALPNPRQWVTRSSFSDPDPYSR